MNTIFGLIDLQGKPLPTERFGRMRKSALQLRQGPCAERVAATSALAALGDRGSLARGGPSQTTVVFEGRLDNRRELAKELAFDPPGSAADLVLAAYDAWGRGCVDRLVGAFALAIWDPHRHRLVCARDALGINTLFYSFDKDQAAFASQLRQVLATRESAPPLNEEYLCVFLQVGAPAFDATPYQGIHKLKPGHLLVVDAGGACEERYWRPEELPPVVYSDPRDYTRHFLEVFREGVAVCLAAEGPIWCDLSGGLDSSSIVCVAQELILSGRVDVTSFGTFTALLADPDPAKAYVQSVLDKYPVQAHFLPAEEHSAFESMEQAALFYDEPNQQIRFYNYLQAQREMMELASVRVLLRGIAAEAAVLTENPLPLHLPNLLRSGRLLHFGHELFAWQRALGLPLANVFSQCVLGPLKNPTLDRYYDTATTIPSWVAPEFAERLRMRERANRGWMPRRFDDVGNQWHYEKVGRVSSYLDRGLGQAICESRHPFLHRPLIELCLAIPYEHKVLAGTFKPLLRRAMAGILPDRIRLRTDKADIGRWVIHSIARQWPKIAPHFKDTVLESLGLVRGRELFQVLHDFGFGKVKRTTLLSSVVALEFWLRQAVEGAASPTTAALREAAPGCSRAKAFR